MIQNRGSTYLLWALLAHDSGSVRTLPAVLPHGEYEKLRVLLAVFTGDRVLFDGLDRLYVVFPQANGIVVVGSATVGLLLLGSCRSDGIWSRLCAL